MLNSVLVIIVDDHLPGQLSFPQRFFTVKESQQCATVPVTRTYGSNGRVSVTFEVSHLERHHKVYTVPKIVLFSRFHQLRPCVCHACTVVADERWCCNSRKGLRRAERKLGLRGRRDRKGDQSCDRDRLCVHYIHSRCALHEPITIAHASLRTGLLQMTLWWVVFVQLCRSPMRTSACRSLHLKAVRRWERLTWPS